MLVNDPIPVPSEVLLSEMVGFPEIFQHTPLAVTFALPSVVTFPPPVAVVWVIPVIVLVETAGGVISLLVVKDS